MKNLTWQNPGQYFVSQELKKKVKLKCCGIWVIKKPKRLREKDLITKKEKKMKSLLDRIIELGANSVSPEDFKETWGMSLEEHMERMKKLIDTLNKENRESRGTEEAKRTSLKAKKNKRQDRFS